MTCRLVHTSGYHNGVVLMSIVYPNWFGGNHHKYSAVWQSRGGENTVLEWNIPRMSSRGHAVPGIDISQTYALNVFMFFHQGSYCPTWFQWDIGVWRWIQKSSHLRLFLIKSSSKLIPKNDLYSNNIFYTNIFIFTALRGWEYNEFGFFLIQLWGWGGGVNRARRWRDGAEGSNIRSYVFLYT